MISKVTKYTPSNDLINETYNILVEEGIINGTKETGYLKEENIKNIIREDDIDKFVKFSAKPDFNSWEMVSICEDESIYFVNGDRSVSYLQLMVYFGAVKCFKYALIDGSYNDKKISKYAIAGGNNEILHLLEQNGDKFDDCFEVSVKYHRDDICDWLLSNYRCETVELPKTVEYFNITAFIFFFKNDISISKEYFNKLAIFAARFSNLSLIKYFVDNYHVNVHRKANNGKTALFIAIEEENNEMIHYLIYECRICLNSKDTLLGRNELHIATEKNNFALVKFLIEVGQKNVEEKDKKGMKALHIACNNANLEIVKYLVEECNSDVNEKDGSERTALHFASRTNNFELVKYLVEECHIDIEEKDELRRTAVHNAIKKNNLELVQYFVNEHHSSFTKNDILVSSKEIREFLTKKCELNDSCEKGDIENAIRLIEEEHFYVDQKCKSETALHIACKKNNIELVKYLIKECNANVNAKDDRGNTAMDIAVAYKYFKLVGHLRMASECYI